MRVCVNNNTICSVVKKNNAIYSVLDTVDNLSSVYLYSKNLYRYIVYKRGIHLTFYMDGLDELFISLYHFMIVIDTILF